MTSVNAMNRGALAIEACNVVKAFDGAIALDGATLHVERGSVYGLVGPNGAGKSTLINCIAGIYRPNRGSVAVGGEPVFDNPSVKESIFTIHDEAFFYLGASMRDMKRLLRGVYRSFDEERYNRLAEVFSEVDDAKPMRTLSKGMVKQAAFWLALSCRPAVLLLDEPVDGLDPIMRRRLWQVLAGDVYENGTTVLLSSHNLRELEDVCDHVGIMNHGRMLLEQSLADLQGGVSKVQVLFDDEALARALAALAEAGRLVHQSAAGRMRTLIVHGESDAVRSEIEAFGPQYMEVLPLNLEEIFMYELGGADHDVANILL